MRAIISVFDKSGVVELAEKLTKLGVEVISSGGTYSLLEKEGISVSTVESVTEFGECLGGRVKTLHPNIHAGILANRELEEHMQTLEQLGIAPIDLVVVNLYPFREVIANPDHTLEQAIENIDIGGPSMIRAAAKNYKSVVVLTDQADYSEVVKRLENDTLDEKYRFRLACKAFKETAAYDSAISSYLEKAQANNEEYPETITLTLSKKQDLRYGENPQQTAAYYINQEIGGIESAKTLHGKELSYNNINDTQGAIGLALEFSQPVCVAVKHSTPCGVGIGENLLEAYKKAYDCDPVSIFGGIICVNRTVDLETAELMSEVFLEVIVAPSFDEKAYELLSQKKNLRLLSLESLKAPKPMTGIEFKGVGGGILVQQADDKVFDNKNQVVTEKSPSEGQMKDLEFAMTVVKHVKSNAIVVAKNGQTLGIGGGEVSRIWATEAALARGGKKTKGAVMASDAFFPFPDVVEACGEKGIAAIIQPGGSNNDQLSIDECNKREIPMVFTGVRHFKH